MNLYATLDEAIEAAREEFIEANVDNDPDKLPQQFNLQKYITIDGETMWQGHFTLESDPDAPPSAYHAIASAEAIFEGDFDELELEEEWPEESTLYEWDEGEYRSYPHPDHHQDDEDDEWEDEEYEE
jgi:acidic protein MsyB